ncbi:MAG: lysostaphin resistance A-like protein [Terriglobia bacterium]
MDSTGQSDSVSQLGGTGQPPQQAGEKDLIVRVFLNSNEVRSGWRLLIFLFLFAANSIIISALGRGLARASAHHFSPLALVTGDGLALLALLVATLIMAALERRSFSDYGLPWRRAFQAQFWSGALWGWAALTLLLLLIRLYRGFDFGWLALRSWKGLLYYAAVWALAFLVVGFFEEFFFRGYALYTLASGMGFWPAAIVLSVAFGLVHLHNPGEDLTGGIAAALIGLFFCFTVRRTGTLWFAIGLHSLWDYCETFVYAVPDSGMVARGHLLNSRLHGPGWLTGGAVGPEGSLFVFIVVVNLFIVLHLVYPKARYPKPKTSLQGMRPASHRFKGASQA